MIRPPRSLPPDRVAMTATVTIRSAVGEDAAALAELGARTFRDTYGSDTDPRDMEAFLASAFSEEVQRAELADPASPYLVAEVAGCAAGFALLRDEPAPVQVAGERPLLLAQLYVDRPFQGRGVGKALMAHCVDGARRNGYGVVWLTVWEHNARAIAFYAGWGFVHEGELPFVFGGEVHRDLVLALRLA